MPTNSVQLQDWTNSQVWVKLQFFLVCKINTSRFLLLFIQLNPCLSLGALVSKDSWYFVHPSSALEHLFRMVLRNGHSERPFGVKIFRISWCFEIVENSSKIFRAIFASLRTLKTSRCILFRMELFIDHSEYYIISKKT